MASYEQTKERMMRLYPDLFPDSDHCLVQLFLAYGNGYYWKDGELVDRFNIPESQIIAEREEFERVSRRNREELVEILARMEDQERGNRMIRILDELHAPVPLMLYPISRKYSAIFDVPDDVKPDWLEAIHDAINLVLNSAHTLRKPVDWFNADEEVEKATEALETLNRRFGDGTNRFKVGDYVKIYMPDTDTYHICEIVSYQDTGAVIGDWYAASYPNCVTDGVFNVNDVECATEGEYMKARGLFDALWGLLAKAEEAEYLTAKSLLDTLYDLREKVAAEVQDGKDSDN